MGPSRRQTLQSLAGLAGGLSLAGCTQQSARGDEGVEDSDDDDRTTEQRPDETAPDGTPGAIVARPDLGGYLDDVSNYGGSVTDRTGADELTVTVGSKNGYRPVGFGPPAVHIDNGTTVTWEWTGEGGSHNVVAEDETFESGALTDEAGVTFEHTFEDDGIYRYYCNPHRAMGMKGVVVVGTDYPTRRAGDQSHGTPSSTPAVTTHDMYLRDVENYDASVADRTGQSEATVEVGVDNGGNPFGFGPPAIRIDPGTTVEWEWTGEGGGHSVVAENGSFESDNIVSSPGVNFEHTFEIEGTYRYYCTPHKSSGMKGVVIVGSDWQP